MPIAQDLARLPQSSPDYAARFVDLLLSAATVARASDVHLHPRGADLEIRWRIDGVLQTLGSFPRGTAADVITRLKVLAQLLTYRNDVPQEGRLRSAGVSYEMRLSTFPTLHGERAVVRLFAAAGDLLLPEQLGFPADILRGLQQSLAETSGAVVVAGPAGAGKTTTAYACLRRIVQDTVQSKNVVTLEDPIEAALEGVSQSQIHSESGFDLASGLRSLLRQDPEVILVGEMRDRDTAEGVFQASLTGHLVLTTYHAGSAAEAFGRLLEMGIEPYLLRSGLLAVLCQRLVRRLCDCSAAVASSNDLLGLPVPLERARQATGCPACLQTGYRGRTVLAEILSRQAGSLTGGVLQRMDTQSIQAAALEAGLVPIWQRATDAVLSGVTSPGEIRRVLGFAADRG
jgi:type II secretory ATPase GspE/PulE/Tfp pilus assembly ATPase PilB-like protein